MKTRTYEPPAREEIVRAGETRERPDGARLVVLHHSPSSRVDGTAFCRVEYGPAVSHQAFSYTDLRALPLAEDSRR